MLIKCPQCSTGYNIPLESIGDKPKKMRCTRCKHVFTMARKAESTPQGYEEFTGKESLPSEFSFLRESPSTAPVATFAPFAKVEEKPPAPTASSTPPAPSAPPTPSTEGLYRSIADEKVETIPLEPTPISGPAPASAPAPAPVPAEQPVVVAQQTPAVQGVNDVSSTSIYDSPSEWEIEAPMELGGYVISEENPRAQFIGKTITVGLLIVGLFFIFVAYRNGWRISPSKLPAQINVAFGGASEVLPDEVDGIEVTVDEKKIVLRNGQKPLIVATGKVFNSDLRRSHVMLRGRIFETNGEKKQEVKFPCGKITKETDLETVKADSDSHYRSRGGKIYNCVLGPDSTVYYQMITPAPAGYSNADKLEVVAVSARFGE